MKLVKNILLFAAILGLVSFFVWQSGRLKTAEPAPEDSTVVNPKAETTYVKNIEVTEGSTFGKLMETASVSPLISQAIFDAAQNVYDLTNIRLGRVINLVYDKQTDEFKQLIYQIDSEEELFVTREQNSQATTTVNVWAAERKMIPYEIKIKTVEGTIDSSMWESALSQGIDERAIIAFADVFQWTVDFAWQVRSGDKYKFIYEERYLKGEYIMPGKILAGKFTNEGKDLFAFYYAKDQIEGYYDQDANSTQKIFLKAPLSFKYITSGFTTGSRYISAFNISTGHRAIDYAAAAGTPVRAVGDGTVSLAGWDGSYGNKVSIRHNGTYSTNYAHLSRIAVKRGQKVTQGQIIGYVGSTGLSTGPHLHYEMVKNGTKINPLLEELPSGEAIKEESRQDYFETIKSWQEQLR
ncbi:MAG: peptidoglycan DD-metalloendopeptidase family protein [Candidatus Buchananbacteria bacterium]|nr:peptidoglycan DD-metalloendopeptidase family protein [Candidatus Buchananbacteria bacterium]